MTKDDLNNEYFEWLYNLVRGQRYAKTITCRKLITRLHVIPFRYSIPRDQNRADDGCDLRWRFICEKDYPQTFESYLDGPCSVLEMMVALATRCEENIMDDPVIGNRMGQWFWGMIVNLGLGGMFDNNFDKSEVDRVIERFLNREYSPNGKGGLFTLRNTDKDMRTVEIWHQMCWYLDSIV